MGRFTSVQGFADNNSSNRTITYDQAKGVQTNTEGGASASGGGTTGGEANRKANNTKLTVEKVVNPYGSTSGAGSGEFHVYRHSRARETARWKHIDETTQYAHDEEVFQHQVQQDQRHRDAKTDKNRAKRSRQKAAKKRKLHLVHAGIVSGPTTKQGTTTRTSTTGEEEEFTYIPVATLNTKNNEQQQQTNSNVGNNHNNKDEDKDNDAKEDTVSIPNDGSFLELMKQKLQQKQQ